MENEKEYVDGKIQEIKNYYEKGKENSNDKKIFEINENFKVKDKVHLCQERLKEFEEKRKKIRFDEITKKFIEKDVNEKSELDNIRKSIILENQGNFTEKLKKYDSKYKHFIEETESICENYENEIEFLRSRLEEIHVEIHEEKNNFENLEILHNFTESFICDPKHYFLQKMKIITESDPSFEDISTIYNEKISELFDENEKLQSLIKEKEISYTKEREESFKTINEIYSEKFSELFGENHKLREEIDDLYTKEKDNVKEIETIRMQKEALENEKIENHSEIEKLKFEKTALTTKLDEKIIEYKNLEELLLFKNSENISKSEENLTYRSKISELERSVVKLDEALSENQRLKEISQKYEESLKQNSKDSDQITRLTALNSEISIKLERALEDMKSLKDKYLKLSRENDDFQNIITKDAITLKELKQFKSKTEINNEANNIIIEENALLHNELKLLKMRFEEESIKNKENVETLNKEKSELENTIKDLESQIVIEKEKIMPVIIPMQTASTNFETNLQKRGSLFNIPGLSSISGLSNEQRFQINFIKIIIADYIYYLYLYNNSISLQNIVDILIHNYSFFIDTIFTKESRPISMIHEILEDFILRIIDTHMAQSNKPIEAEHFNIDFVKRVCESFDTLNLFTKINSMSNKDKSIDEIFDIFVNKYKKLFKIGENYFLSLGIENLEAVLFGDVKEMVKDKIEKNRKNVNEELRALIEYIVANIQAGKLVNKGQDIYDFREYFVNYAKNDYFDVSNSENYKINARGLLSTKQSVTNITQKIKLSPFQLNTIILDATFDPKFEFAFNTISIHIQLYAKHLNVLEVVNCNLCSETTLTSMVKLIESLKELSTLNLMNNNLHDQGLKIICEAIKYNKTVKQLDLSKNEITEKGGFYLAEAMIKNEMIEYLILRENYINDSGLCSLLNVLNSNNKVLKHFDISNNDLLSDTDMHSVCDLIKTSTSLVSLDLSNNSIDSQSAFLLGLAIKNSKLERLSLNCVDLNEESAPLLFKNLSEANLKEIYLDENSFGEVGAIMFANVLKSNKHLKLVSLRRNKISSMFLMCLSKTLDSTCIETVNLEENKFDDLSLYTLRNSLVNHPIKFYFSKHLFAEKSLDDLKEVDNFIFK